MTDPRTPDAPAVTYKTLRDEIAMGCLFAYLRGDTPAATSIPTFKSAAKMAYRWADAMLAAREAK